MFNVVNVVVSVYSRMWFEWFAVFRITSYYRFFVMMTVRVRAFVIEFLVLQVMFLLNRFERSL